MPPDLDPREEDHDGERRVEDDLPVADELKVGVVVGLGEQRLELVVDGDRAVDVEGDAADRDENDDDVEHVPELLEVREAVALDLQSSVRLTVCSKCSYDAYQPMVKPPQRPSAGERGQVFCKKHLLTERS